PLLIGYDKPDFWTNELFNIFTFNHGFQRITDLYHHTSAGSVSMALQSLLVLILWKRTLSKRIPFLPASFITVLFGILLTVLLQNMLSPYALKPSQFVTVPQDIFS